MGFDCVYLSVLRYFTFFCIALNFIEIITKLKLPTSHIYSHFTYAVATIFTFKIIVKQEGVP